jgi:type VI secretion system protein
MRYRSEGSSAASLERAILEHLLVLLNTRHGSCSMDPGYGLPDLTDLAHNVPEGVPALQHMIVEAIQRYEPRLQAVSVRPVPLSPGSLSLSFEVRAELVAGGSLRFETKVSRGGQVVVT